LVNGIEQRNGAEARAISHATHTAEVDTFQADITTGYPEAAKLSSLIRQVSLHRSGNGTVEIIDTFKFIDTPSPFESALMTYGETDLSVLGTVLIQGKQGSLKVTYDPGKVSATVEEFDSNREGLRIAHKYPKVRRIAFQLKKSQVTGELKLSLTPQ
jgi:hypothetical protein